PLRMLCLGRRVILEQVPRSLAQLYPTDEQVLDLAALVPWEWLRTRVEVAIDAGRDEPVVAGAATRHAVPPRPSDRAPLADLDHSLSRRIVAPRRGEDPDLVAELPKVDVLLADVRVRAARSRIGIRRDDADLHLLFVIRRRARFPGSRTIDLHCCVATPSR